MNWDWTFAVVILTLSLVTRGWTTRQRQHRIYDHYGRRLRITPKECQSSSPRFASLNGVCMFNLECQEQSGTVIGACVDRFLFGACCHLPHTLNAKPTAEALVANSSFSEALKSTDPPSPTQSHVPAPTIPSPSPPLLPKTPGDIYPTRFPSRSPPDPLPPLHPPAPSRRVPPHALLDEALVALDAAGDVVSTRERATVPPPSDAATLLPLTLETFSSVSHPLGHGHHGDHHFMRHPHDQPTDSVERQTLGLSFVVTKDRVKPRPSSVSIRPRPHKTSDLTLDSTEEPPKISTFMYVNDDTDHHFNKMTFPTTTTETPEGKTVPSDSEDIQSNTENIWDVVMQLGSHGGVDLVNSDHSEVNPTSLTSDQDQDQDSSSDFRPTAGGLNLDNTFLKLSDSVSVTTTSPKYESDTETEESEVKPTTRPWASSTYFVHTFKYPNFTAEDSQDEDTSDFSTTTTTKKTSAVSSTPSIGKITTWSGVGTVVDKEYLANRHSDSVEDDSNSDSSGSDYKKPLTTLFIKTTPMVSTTTTTTQRPTTTRRVYTTRRTTTTTTPTPTPTPRPSTTTTTTMDLWNDPTERWKKPKPYTLPPHKRPTTPQPTSRPERTTRRTTTSKKPPKLGTKSAVPILKNEERPNFPSIILDEEMDTNLDDFVEQVVQGLAGSLDNLNLEKVILPPDAGSGVNDNLIDATAKPSQVISDPLFPPFPIVGEVTLNKPNKHQEFKDLEVTTTTTTTTQKPLDWKRDCGVRTLPKSGRIVGGTASKFGRWPWQALVKEATWLGLFSKNKCGGVLIAPKYVLTAAHCQPGFLATLTVVLGEFDISASTESQNAVTKNVRRVIVHRDYNAQTFENDIALLELDSPVEFQSHIVPICMPNDEEEFLGRKAYVTGWGRLKYGGGVPQILHEVDVPILKNDECQDMFHKSNHLKAIRDSFICAGYAEGFKDSCEGDSGGPLSIQRPSGQWVLAGTVSHGIKCAYPNLPGVYMRMTFYKPWIKRVTGIK